MWCINCRQDVPALLSGESGSFCCPRCGADICAHNAERREKLFREDDGAKAGRAECGPSGEPADDNSPPLHDAWEVGEELREIGRALRAEQRDDRPPRTDHRRESRRLDRPHADWPDWHAPAPDRSAKRRPIECDSRTAASPLTWLSLAAGTIGFVGGCALMGWSFASGRPELWSIGLPTALVGQLLLLLGLLMQLDRMRCDNRRAASKLDEVDAQIRDLKAAAALLSASQGPASTTFYSHFAGGAGPQLLLADLKSQLDLLAVRIAQEE